MYKSSFAMAAAMLSAPLINAHVEMTLPYPYGPGSLNNSPLAKDGIDFPCKLRTGTYDPPVAANNMVIGEIQTLSFKGSAVHGGGSCQVSLTKDMQPTIDSDWFAIRSFEGGCPASIPGNYPSDPESREAPDFEYTIPEGVAPGEYTLAWTWFNKVGEREMYMNCAPITVKSNQGKSYNEEASFPPMFVANIGINGCRTEEGFDLQFPDPGDLVVTGNGTTNFGGPKGCTDSPPSGGSNYGSTPSAPKPASNPIAAPEAMPQAETPQAQTQEPEIAQAQTQEISDEPVIEEPEEPPTPAPEAPEASYSPTPTPETPGASYSPTPTPESPGSIYAPTGSGDALSGPCPTEGEWNCIGGSSFQRCGSGVWSVVQTLAAGNVCKAGQGAELSIIKPSRLRNRGFHFRRHQQHA